MEELKVPLALFAAGGAVVVVMLLLRSLRKLLHVCAPNEILIFSGRSHQTADGEVGFRVVFGGRALRVPFLEKVDRMDMTLLSVPMAVAGAYSQGGIPLSVHAIANVKVSSDPQVVGNAIERFLGHDSDAIANVAKQTLEGHLRGVLANMTPEEVNEDRLKFAERLRDEAEEDLMKLGLQLDTLKIQHVTDDRHYLDSIGRARISEVLRGAEVAESDAMRAAEQAEAAAQARGEVAGSQAEANIQRKQNELRQKVAELDAQAKSEEARAVAAGQEAHAAAQAELQEVRARLEQLRLQADVTIPAEAERRVRELEAAGAAATISENGRAMSEALDAVSEAWKAAGSRAMEMYVLQNLDTLMARVAAAASQVQVSKVSVVDSGDGETLARYASAYPAMVGALLREAGRTLGVDLGGAVSGSTNVKENQP